MKKCIIPLLCVCLLTGCDVVFSDETNEKEDNSEPTLPTENPEEYSNNLQPKPDDNGEGQGEENNDHVYTKTIVFYNSTFTNSTLDQEGSRNNFVNWFNGEDDLLETITTTGYSQINYIGNAGEPNTYTILTLGKSSQNGSITFNFKYDVVSVKIKVQAYTKYVEYTSSWNTDTNSKFYLDTEEHDLSLEENYKGDTTKYDYSKSYNPATKQVTISSSGGRVFVHSMEINYKKNSV